MKTTLEGIKFHSAIKETRIRYGLTIKQVESLTGVPYRSLQNWELGVRKCPDYVSKMVVTMIVEKFGKPDHQIFLEDLLYELKGDLKFVDSGETESYINSLIRKINEHLNK